LSEALFVNPQGQIIDVPITHSTSAYELSDLEEFPPEQDEYKTKAEYEQALMDYEQRLVDYMIDEGWIRSRNLGPRIAINAKTKKIDPSIIENIYKHYGADPKRQKFFITSNDESTDTDDMSLSEYMLNERIPRLVKAMSRRY